MDFKDQIAALAKRVSTLKDKVATEEATKNAMVMPMLQCLGYDVFNPLEVVPEFVCDIPKKKNEKIDYAIFKDGQPVILIECKHFAQNLDVHNGQLLRYFTVSHAKFGILTNGIVYRFYTDTVRTNKMDDTPFLEVDLENLTEQQTERLKEFHKSSFDIGRVLSIANEMKLLGELRNALHNELTNPSDEFVKLLGKQVHDGMFTAKVVESMKAQVKKTAQLYINEVIRGRLKQVMNHDQEEDASNLPQIGDLEDDGIVTTAEELESYYIIKSLCKKVVDPSRLHYRDNRSYMAVMLDNNRNKTIARLYFNTKNKYVSYFDKDRKEVKMPISDLNDIYGFEAAMSEACKSVLSMTAEKGE